MKYGGKTLRECIFDAKEKGVAIGHFNISNLEGLWAIFLAAQKLSVPVMIGLSEGERKFVGVKQASALVESLREEYNFPIFLNADHCYSFQSVKEAVENGFDMAIIDGAKMPFEQNVLETKRCVDFVKKFNNENKKDILVEAELGYIGQSSKILDAPPENLELTTASLSKDFVLQTGIDLFAPSVGNVHGVLRSGEPELKIDRIAEIKKEVDVPLVLHGASGNSIEDIKMAINHGISVVHINTELRLIYKDSLEKSLKDFPDEIAPYKIMTPVVLAMQNFVEEKLKIFNNLR